MRQLTLIRDGFKAAEYRLDLPDVVIGRGSSAHIRLDDNRVVSRQHCLVRERGQAHMLEDLGGANGTFVNGHTIDVHMLRPGDRILFGEETLRYDFAASTATSLAGIVQKAQARVVDQVTEEGLMAIEELSISHVEAADELDELRSIRREQPAEHGDHKEGTMVADRDQLEALLEQMLQKAGPHVVVVGSAPEQVHQLEGRPGVGYTEQCVMRLPGRRWLPGRVAGHFVDQGGWCFVPASTFWLPARINGDKLDRLRRLEHGDTIEVAGQAYEYRRGDDR